MKDFVLFFEGFAIGATMLFAFLLFAHKSDKN